MLETVREYAAEQLAASGEEGALRQRHAAFCLDLAERHEIVPLLASDARQFDRLEAERPNLRSALAWFEAIGDVVGLRRLVAAVGFFWWLGGHLHEGLPWLERALAVGEQAAATGEMPNVPIRVAVPYGATISIGGRAFDQAERVLTDALVRAREIDDRLGAATVLVAFGYVANLRGDFAGAEAHLDDVLSLTPVLPDPRQSAALQAAALTNLGDALRFQGRFEQAAAHTAEALGDATMEQQPAGARRGE